VYSTRYAIESRKVRKRLLETVLLYSTLHKYSESNTKEVRGGDAQPHVAIVEIYSGLIGKVKENRH